MCVCVCVYMYIYTHTHIYIYIYTSIYRHMRGRNCDSVGSPILPVETAIAVPTRIMLVGTEIAVSTGRIADPTRTTLPYLGRICDSVKAVIVLIYLAIYGNS